MDELDKDYETEVMQGSVDELAAAVVGERIVSIDRSEPYHRGSGMNTILTLGSGRRVKVTDTDDCCAFTEVEAFEFLEEGNHVITRVEAEDGFTRWFIYADSIPVAKLGVEWSPGNPYYYGFGFSITVEEENNND